MREQIILSRRCKAKVLILAVTALTMTLPVVAQQGSIILPNKELGAVEVFENIQRQTNYTVAINSSQAKNLSVNIGSPTVEVKVVLEKMLQSSGLTYRMDGNYIIITEAPVEEPKVSITHNVKDVVIEQAENDAEASLVMDNKLSTASPAQPSSLPQASKTTVFYVPDNRNKAAHAFSDEPITEYSFVPSSKFNTSYFPKAAIKTNLLYLATTSPNIAVEFGLGRKWTLDIVAGINPFDLNGDKGGIRHGLVQPEVRYWFCNRFEKWFIGLHGIYGQYQIQNIDLSPFGNDLTDKRYDGWGVGAGLSGGYHLPMGKRWGWEFTLGLGYIYLDYDKYNCGECDNFVANKTKHWFGPTKAGISLIFMIK